MRLIDADAVISEQRGIMESLYGGSIKTLKEHMDIDDDLSIPMHGMEGYAKAKQFFYGLKDILEAAQTVSAIPVVYCKDCEYSWEDIGGLTCSYGRCVDCRAGGLLLCGRSENGGCR